MSLKTLKYESILKKKIHLSQKLRRRHTNFVLLGTNVHPTQKVSPSYVLILLGTNVNLIQRVSPSYPRFSTQGQCQEVIHFGSVPISLLCMKAGTSASVKGGHSNKLKILFKAKLQNNWH